MMDVDPSQSFLDFPPHPLEALFRPTSVAIIGATEKPSSVGYTLVKNLLHFPGTVIPVNPKYKTVLGLPCLPHVPTVDLAVIATPAATIPAILDECGAAGVKTAIIISAGFKELGAPGLALENQVVARAAAHNIRLIGPNCLGIQSGKLNATFAASTALEGNIAFISQSGAMCTAVLDWSLKEGIGFSAFVSLGSMADIDFGDLIEYFGNDPHTDSILIYMETIGDARSFLSAAREVAMTKPIIVIKPGRTEAAAKAAVSHTGSLAGSDEVFDAAMRRVGVLRVDTINELFDMAQLVAKQPRPKGPRLTIVTNAGGPAVLASDAACLAGAELAPLSAQTFDALNSFLPKAWSRSNPIDILGDASAETFERTLQIVAEDPNTDGLLVILSPQDMTDAAAVARKLVNIKIPGKPILAAWMGGVRVEEGFRILEQSPIATFAFPDSAARLFARLWGLTRDLNALWETPDRFPALDPGSKPQTEIFLQKLGNRTLLTETESKELLSIWGIPVCPTSIAHSAEEAVILAEKFGFPVVLKLHSHTITHKTDVGGVKLNLRTPDEVRTAYRAINSSEGVAVQPMVTGKCFELILGSTTDPQFGPVLLFGLGGQWVEIFHDSALALPPLHSTLARHLIEQTRISKALKGARGQKGINLQALEDILVRFSHFILALPGLVECDINPLMASPDKLIAVDARIVLSKEPLPIPALRPYPYSYITRHPTLPIDIRPIRPEDETALTQFHKALSEDSVKKRYLASFALDDRIRHQRLVRICTSDFDKNITFVAESGSQIIAIARLSRLPGTATAVLSMTVLDAFQHKGLGTLLLNHLLTIGKIEGLHTIIAAVSKNNTDMLHLLQKLEFTIEPTEQAVVQARKSL